MPLTLKEAGGGGPDIFPHKIDYSALMESGYSSTGAPAANATIALGWKPTAATSGPLGDMTGHYAITIRKVGDTITVWKGATELDAYGGSAGSTYAELVDNVLTYYGGEKAGYYSRLAVVEESLTYSSFWEPSDLVTGLLIPKDISGLTIHAQLDFSNGAALGEDASGNGNDWAVNGAPVQTTDTPTNNYCVLNALDPDAETLGSGNLTLAGGSARPTLQPENGWWYYEKDGVGVSYNAETSGKFEPALTAGTYNFGATAWSDSGPTGCERALCSANLGNPTVLKSATVADVVLREGIGSGEKITGATATADSSYSTQTPAKAVDGTTTYFWQSASGFPHWLKVDLGSAIELATYSIRARADSQLARTPYDWVFQGSNDGSTWNNIDSRTAEVFSFLGQEKSYAITSPGSYRYYRVFVTANQPGGDGYCAICELEGQVSPASVDSLLFSPDLVDIKDRDSSSDWMLFDTERGAGHHLHTDTVDAENYVSNTLTSFDVYGYSLGDHDPVNRLSASFIDLCLKAGADQGFAIVPYIGTGVRRTIAHGLGKAPTFAIVKNLDSADDWTVYHAALGATKWLRLNDSATATTSTLIWGDTEPTSTVLTVDTNDRVNASGERYIAYLFADSDVFKAFSYTGNGSTNGPFVNLGGKPLAIPFLKQSDGTNDWRNMDAVRDPFNTGSAILEPNTSDAEISSARWNCASQGISFVTTSGDLNANGSLYVGLAILESAGKYANAF